MEHQLNNKEQKSHLEGRFSERGLSLQLTQNTGSQEVCAELRHQHCYVMLGQDQTEVVG